MVNNKITTATKKRGRKANPSKQKTLTVFDTFQAEVLTASKINAKCVTHNVDLEDKYNLIGHIATLPNDKHRINARTQLGQNVEFDASISIRNIKTIEAKNSNPKSRSIN